jgi:hypothetical protein
VYPVGASGDEKMATWLTVNADCVIEARWVR